MDKCLEEHDNVLSKAQALLGERVEEIKVSVLAIPEAQDDGYDSRNPFLDAVYGIKHNGRRFTPLSLRKKAEERASSKRNLYGKATAARNPFEERCEGKVDELARMDFINNQADTMMIDETGITSSELKSMRILTMQIAGNCYNNVAMETREDILNYCNTFSGVFVDQPFNDGDWVLARHIGNRKAFTWTFTRQGRIWMNVKLDEDARLLYRSRFDSVQPAYHMNKLHWSSVILDGTVPDEDIRAMIELSYQLTL